MQTIFDKISGAKVAARVSEKGTDTEDPRYWQFLGCAAAYMLVSKGIVDMNRCSKVRISVCSGKWDDGGIYRGGGFGSIPAALHYVAPFFQDSAFREVAPSNVVFEGRGFHQFSFMFIRNLQ